MYVYSSNSVLEHTHIGKRIHLEWGNRPPPLPINYEAPLPPFFRNKCENESAAAAVWLASLFILFISFVHFLTGRPSPA